MKRVSLLVVVLFASLTWAGTSICPNCKTVKVVNTPCGGYSSYLLCVVTMRSGFCTCSTSGSCPQYASTCPLGFGCFGSGECDTTCPGCFNVIPPPATTTSSPTSNSVTLSETIPTAWARQAKPEWVDNERLREDIAGIGDPMLNLGMRALKDSTRMMETKCTSFGITAIHPETRRTWKIDVIVKPEGNASVIMHSPDSKEDESLSFDVVRHRWHLVREGGDVVVAGELRQNQK